MSNTISRCCVSATVLVLAAPSLQADSFASAYYDASSNELVVTMSYRGTNPDHEFSLEWGDCQALGDDGARHEIVGEVVDSQWNDDEERSFTKTVRFSVANLDCRPATVTLRTAPRFEYTLRIP